MKTTATIMIMLFLASIVTVAIPVEAGSGIVLDGEITAGEWDEATSFSLVMGGISTYTAYVTNDDQFMYVAFDYAIAIGSDFASFNVYKEGAFTPNKIIAPVVVPLGLWNEIIDGVMYPPFTTDRLWDTITDDTPTNGIFIFAEWDRYDGTVRFDCSVDVDTEMKVPLGELGLDPGDSIKTMFVLNEHMVGTHVYPAGANSLDPNTYETYTLWPSIEDIRVEIELLAADDFDNIHACDGQKQSLLDKIDDVIGKVDAGEYHAAICKLEKDIKDKIEKWIVDDDAKGDLIDKIDLIISLLQTL